MKKTCILVCLLILSACSKDDNITIADGTYESNGNIQLTPAILYTKGESIKDAGIVNAYLQRHGLNDAFNMKSGNDTTSGQLTFTFSGTTATTSGKTYDVIYKSAGSALLVEQDTAWEPSINTSMLNCKNVSLKVALNSAPRNTCVYYPTGQYCGLKPQFPIIKNGSSLILPLMSFSFSQTNGGICGYSEYYRRDYLNTAMLSELQTTDTLLVQSSMLTLYKK